MTRVHGMFGVTVGEDVFTVHKARVVGEDPPKHRPLCDSGTADDEITTWRRAVNCEACLRLPDPEDDYA